MDPQSDPAHGDEVNAPDDPLLSVVVVTRNERERIGACLESILAACRPIDRFEILLVDSRSTDGTVDVARDYPVTVLELPEGPPVTAAAGRYVGTAATSGDLVLFVDGDVVLTDDWLTSACRRLRDDPTLGGLDGHLDESAADADRPVDALRGVALYDRGALETAGGFDPHLVSNEDIDLSYRVRDAGYRLRRLSTVVGFHPDENGPRDRLRRWHRGYYHGRGQLARKYVRRPALLAQVIYRHRLYYAIVGWFVIGLATRALALRREFAAWGFATTIGAVASSNVWSPSWTVDRVANTGPFVAGVVLGFRRRDPGPDAYPLDAVDVLQRPTGGPAVGGQLSVDG